MNKVVVHGKAISRDSIFLRGRLFRMYDFYLSDGGVIQVISTKPIKDGDVTLNCEAYSYFSKDYKGRKLNLCLLFVSYTEECPQVYISGHICNVGKLYPRTNYLPITITINDCSNSSYIPCFCEGELSTSAKCLVAGTPVGIQGQLYLKATPKIHILKFCPLHNGCNFC